MKDTVVNAVIDGANLRLHFNRHGAAPLVWCISTANRTIELAVRGWRSYAHVETVYTPKETPDDEDGLPSGWLRPVQPAREYRIQIVNGWATITYADNNTEKHQEKHQEPSL